MSRPIPKERYDYIKGNYDPSSKPQAPPPVVVVQQAAAAPAPDAPLSRVPRDVEAQTSRPKEKKKERSGCYSCLGKCCCVFMLLVIVLAIVASVLIGIYFPKLPDAKIASFDFTKSATFELNSDNSYDIKVKNLYGDINYEHEKVLSFETDPFVIVKKDKSLVEIRLKDPKPTKALLEFCKNNKEFPADIKGSLEVSWLPFSLGKRQTMNLPCPPIPKDLESVDKLLDGKKINDKDVAQLIADKQAGGK
jgi:hypothetical protein